MPSTQLKKTTRSNSSTSRKSPSTSIKKNIEATSYLRKLLGEPSLAKTIRATRLCDEISQHEFAKRLGISKQHLCDIEKGRKLVSPGRAWKWAEQLGYLPLHWVELAVQDLLRKEGLKDLTIKLGEATN